LTLESKYVIILAYQGKEFFVKLSYLFLECKGVNMKYSHCPSCKKVFEIDKYRICPNCKSNLLYYGDRKCTLYVRYDPFYAPVSDFGCDDTYKLLLENCEKQFANPLFPSIYRVGFSTENILNRIRLGVLEGEFTFDVVFKYRHLSLLVDSNGRIDNWPEGFCDYNEHIQEKILNTREGKE